MLKGEEATTVKEQRETRKVTYPQSGIKEELEIIGKRSNRNYASAKHNLKDTITIGFPGHILASRTQNQLT